VYTGVWGLPPKLEEFSRIFVSVFVHIVCKLTFNCRLPKKIGGAGWYLLLPQYFCWGSSPCSPASRAYVERKDEGWGEEQLVDQRRQHDQRGAMYALGRATSDSHQTRYCTFVSYATTEPHRSACRQDNLVSGDVRRPVSGLYFIIRDTARSRDHSRSDRVSLYMIVQPGSLQCRVTSNSAADSAVGYRRQHLRWSAA